MVAYLDEGGARYLVKKVLDRIQPVGSLYFSTNSTSPASLFGGAWERYAQGRVMVSASDTDTDFTVGKTGGEKTHQHEYGWIVCNYYSSPLIVPGSQNQTHSDSGVLSWDNEGHPSPVRGNFTWKLFDSKGFMEKNAALAASTGGYVRNVDRYAQTAITNISSNVQPYISVYIWRRTA